MLTGQPNAICKWCHKMFTMDSDGPNLRSAEFDSLFIQCPHCQHSAEYNGRTDIQYGEPEPGPAS
jgi:hypothetical protein